MLNCEQLRELIIEPALYDLKLQSDDATELLIFTAAIESLGGTYLKQIKGPALGVFQMEPRTYNDIWQNYIAHQPNLSLKLVYKFNAPTMPNEDRMIYDLRFAAAMARIHYKRVPAALPKASNLSEIWEYYKRYYNTAKGETDFYEAISAYNRFTNKSHIVASSNCS